MKLLENVSSKVWENFRGPESRPKRGGIGSVTELAMAKQVYKKFDHFTKTSWSLAEDLTVLTRRPLSKIF